MAYQVICNFASFDPLYFKSNGIFLLVNFVSDTKIVFGLRILIEESNLFENLNFFNLKFIVWIFFYEKFKFFEF